MVGWYLGRVFWVHIKYTATTFDYTPLNISIAYIGTGIWGISEGCNSCGCIIEVRRVWCFLCYGQVIHDVDHKDVQSTAAADTLGWLMGW